MKLFAKKVRKRGTIPHWCHVLIGSLWPHCVERGPFLHFGLVPGGAFTTLSPSRKDHRVHGAIQSPPFTSGESIQRATEWPELHDRRLRAPCGAGLPLQLAFLSDILVYSLPGRPCPSLWRP